MSALLFCFAPTYPLRPNTACLDSPRSDEEGWGWCDFVTFARSAPWRETWVATSRMRERSQNVVENTESGPREVEELGYRTKRLAVRRRRFVTLRLSTLDSSTRIRQNKARMYMKTKGNDKKSGSADRRVWGLRLFHDRSDGPLRASVVQMLAEQSQNVYENKRK